MVTFLRLQTKFVDSNLSSTKIQQEAPFLQAVGIQEFSEFLARMFPIPTQNSPMVYSMEPENQPLEKEIPFGNHRFLRFHLKTSGL